MTEHDDKFKPAKEEWKEFSKGYKKAQTWGECDEVIEALGYHAKVIVRNTIQSLADMFGEECVDMRMLHYRNTLDWMIKREERKGGE